nr:GrpB family protein [Kibdelosporangium sp. MJ126-NF4]CEL16623.1 Dephospho-CoA kinase [Kibdelosporangium sp. MJ126-NF4]CTQ89026.1 Dephospho-CoA kinase (EC 2.7.1.24) [Kibdelosporangium sp. MJ126-NF4]
MKVGLIGAEPAKQYPGITWSDVADACLVIAVGQESESADTTVSSIKDMDEVWETRLSPMVRNLSEGMIARFGAPRLEAYNPVWAVTADRLMRRLARFVARPDYAWDHIGSTSVPGLAAKPIVDMQIGVPSLDDIGGIEDAVARAGFVDVAKIAPEAPGVLRDNPRGAGSFWEKRLFASADPGQYAILHVRQLDSPWWHYTTRFRDLLRADPALRSEYERTKLRLAEAHGGDKNFDRYTIAKTAFFDTIQHRLNLPQSQSG